MLACAAAAVMAVTLDAQNAATKQGAPTKTKNGEIVTVTGCVTSGSQAGSYVLTALPGPLTTGMAKATSGTTPTVTYQLSGKTGDLRPLVGHRVEATGTTSPKPKAEVQAQPEKGAKTEQPANPNGPTPKVETSAKAKIEARPLNVTSLKAVEGACTQR
jgi:hypothetical protein